MHDEVEITVAVNVLQSSRPPTSGFRSRRRSTGILCCAFLPCGTGILPVERKTSLPFRERPGEGEGWVAWSTLAWPRRPETRVSPALRAGARGDNGKDAGARAPLISLPVAQTVHAEPMNPKYSDRVTTVNGRAAKRLSSQHSPGVPLG